MKKTYAFISYSSKNKQIADAIKQILDEKELRNWMAPCDIPVGQKYAAVINQALEGCSCIVLLLSNDAQNSIWVNKEIERAVSYGKTIIPIQIEKVVLNDSFKLLIGDTQIISLPQLNENSEEFLKMISSIEALVEKDPAMAKGAGIRVDQDGAVGAPKIIVEEKEQADGEPDRLRQAYLTKKAALEALQKGKRKKAALACILSLVLTVASIIAFASYKNETVTTVGAILFFPAVICLAATFFYQLFLRAKGISSSDLTILKAKILLAEEACGSRTLDHDIKLIVKALASATVLPYNGRVTAASLHEICRISGVQANQTTRYYTAKLMQGYDPKLS